jgi:hypothetical protein
MEGIGLDYFKGVCKHLFGTAEENQEIVTQDV